VAKKDSLGTRKTSECELGGWGGNPRNMGVRERKVLGGQHENFGGGGWGEGCNDSAADKKHRWAYKRGSAFPLEKKKNPPG